MNYSSWSARYAARKMAERRARLEAPRLPEKCRHPQCSVIVPARDMRVLCASHEEERMARVRELISAGDGSDAIDAVQKEYLG